MVGVTCGSGMNAIGVAGVMCVIGGDVVSRMVIFLRVVLVIGLAVVVLSGTLVFALVYRCAV